VPGYAAISDGTGDGVIGACHLSDASDLATIIRLDAGDTAGEAELVGLVVSHASLQARQAPRAEGRKFSDCQSMRDESAVSRSQSAMQSRAPPAENIPYIFGRKIYELKKETESQWRYTRYIFRLRRAV
jgi:hypothetical protein